jgi:hypothetical protein
MGLAAGTVGAQTGLFAGDRRLSTLPALGRELPWRVTERHEFAVRVLVQLAPVRALQAGVRLAARRPRKACSEWNLGWVCQPRPGAP